MDNKDSVQNSDNTIIKHIFRFDDETKANLMNLTQYTMLAIIPVAIIQNISEKIFPEYDSSKGTIELLAEILGQALLTIIGLFFIHRTITAVPTFSGTAMGDLNLFSIIVVFLLTSFMFDSKLQQKMNTISERMIEVWEGKSKDDTKDKKKPDTSQQPVVSVSQPISRSGMPTHQVSQADYIGMHTGMSAPSPPTVQTQQAVGNSQIPTGQEQMPPMMQEPMAANAALGGFASF